MSVIIQTRGEAGGGVAAHLQCPLCGYFSKSYAQQLSHMAATHPDCLDCVVLGRLGNILMYQSGARLFHCAECFYTSKDFTKLYKHVITKHCVDEKEEGRVEGDAGDDGTERVEEKEVEEQEGGEATDEDGATKTLELAKPAGTADEGVLMFDGSGYRCLICGWKHKLKGLAINHVVRKHDIPKAYATQAVRRDAANNSVGANAPRQAENSSMEEEDVSGLSNELLKEEKEVTDKVVRFISNRFVCLICGWKSKLKGTWSSRARPEHTDP